MANVPNKMKVWPGARVMVPMATDVLLVGINDLPQDGHEDSTGTALVSNKVTYWDMYLKNNLGIIEDDLFTVVNRENHLQPGAHIMGKQVAGIDNQGDIAFPLVPNRWLITRLEYNSIADGAVPTVVSHVVKSDMISNGGFPPAPQSESQYPVTTDDLPVSKIGGSVALSDWDGGLPAAGESIDLKASGPAAVSWSVTYDNVREVFGFYDKTLDKNASADNPVYYTYSIVGWYLDPENDVLVDLPTETSVSWQAAIQSEFMWTVGESDADVNNASEAWTAWQEAHGLSGTFDPAKIDLPEQSKNAIIAWHTWQEANGAASTETSGEVLARQLLCHSMVGMVKWEGNTIAYGSGVPLGVREFPTIAMGNNALNNTIATQRNELFMLNYKLYVISLQKVSPIPADVVTQVQQSFDALKAELQKNITLQDNKAAAIQTDSSALTEKLSKTDFILKSAELTGFAAPNDLVIMVAGADLDTKLSASSVNMNFDMLDVRFTGQFITELDVSYDFQGTTTSFPIAATDLLSKVTFPAWNAFPKEVMDLWVETLLLDVSNAALIAVIYFEKRKIDPSVYNAKTQNGGTESPLEELTNIIKKNQSKIYNDSDELEIPTATLVEAAGFHGVPPAHAAVAFRKKQPWTPIFMDWKVKWFPNSKNSTAPLEDWKLEEIDYRWNGKTISDDDALTFSGRSVLNPSIAQNIQLKLSTFKDDPNYDNLPDFIRDDLEYAAERIKNLDILTQSISGFTKFRFTTKR